MSSWAAPRVPQAPCRSSRQRSSRPLGPLSVLPTPSAAATGRPTNCPWPGRAHTVALRWADNGPRSPLWLLSASLPRPLPRPLLRAPPRGLPAPLRPRTPARRSWSGTPRGPRRGRLGAPGRRTAVPARLPARRRGRRRGRRGAQRTRAAGGRRRYGIIPLDTGAANVVAVCGSRYVSHAPPCLQRGAAPLHCSEDHLSARAHGHRKGE